ncbi:putative acetyltransferase [Sinobaca qinghaiensis]|uniref:Putative acetyltransferase n=2 Tax=Sinobaca qinghaiensis TaxID=342944 RepID=A0A419V7E7_9BACL|nr:N-acetyltransferase [Sinobaca qinghaiensis]RKD75960.1 putative acetyltransferase [Sinobaca qinghaiensis]
MRIRPNKETDIDTMVEIWYEGSAAAHHFIDKAYWTSQREEMKNTYLPMAESYVICKDAEIVGFVSMVDSYLAALFIDLTHQGKGHGRELLDFIKARYKHIQLKAYKKNHQAVQFYLKNGFMIKEEKVDENTKEVECVMEWQKA